MNSNILQHNMINMTWCEVEKLAEKNAIVFFPVGVIEEHSLHLPLGTDIYLSIAQAEDMAEEMEDCGCPCIISPPFYWGISSVVTKHFPGSFTSREETVHAALYDILEGLENAGFTRVVLINAHGDPKHREAIVNALKAFNQSHKLIARWFTFEEDMVHEGFNGTEDYVLAVPAYPFEKLVHFTKDPVDNFDVHAGAFETAIMRDNYPELTDMETAKTLRPTLLSGEGIKKWCSGEKENRDVIPDGHAGDPAFSQYVTTDMKTANKALAKEIIKFYERNKA